MKLRIDVVTGPTTVAPPEDSGVTVLANADNTSTIATDLEDYAAAQEQAITAYGHLTAAGLPVNGVYLVQTDLERMVIKGEMTKEGWVNH